MENMLIDENLFDWLVKIRRDIHSWPEPSFEEFKTSEKITKALSKLNIWHKSGVAKTGVIARLDNGGADAPTVALRADIDALAVPEKTGLPFRSKVPGYMHACGHDGHIAILLGAAALLKESPPEGNVVFIFQPAEEGGGGAEAMIEAGALDGVSMIFGGHIDGKFPLGSIAIRNGIETSYTTSFEINIYGRGGHAARPHEGVDAIVVGSLLVVSLQTIVSRNIDPLKPAVISIGSFHAGTAYNAIAEDAVLRGTIRCTDEKIRDRIVERIKTMSSSVGNLHDANIEVFINEGYPPVINHPEGVRVAADTAVKLFGKENLITPDKPSMGGEDFAYYLKRVPGCFVRIGISRPGEGEIKAHSPSFDFDEDVIRIGAVYFAELVRETIRRLKNGELMVTV
ncbi:MAG: amidohydrolase [Nitrospirae bacterium]|nr:MAG: amidohydrolase [Nitrospirota bacterium]